MTLTEFLLARIAEDWADAMSGWRWKSHPAGEYERLQARALARCEADRRIAVLLEDIAADPSLPSTHLARHVLRILASVYSSHPDYRQEWAI